MRKTGKFIVTEKGLQEGSDAILLGSIEWQAWLAEHNGFTYQGSSGHFTAQCETRRSKTFWYAYRRREGRLFKHYLGRSTDLTVERMNQAAAVLAGHSLLAPPAAEHVPGGESRIDTSLLPMTKVNNPILPVYLLPRARLTRQINNPLTMVSAPSGFGKSTLLNDWKRNCSYPVAWLALDDTDDHTARFWHSVVMALRTIRPDFGKELLRDLRASAPIPIAEIVSRLTNHILNDLSEHPRFGLVIDDFQHITDPEVIQSVQFWLEHLPANLQIILLGHTKSSLSLGHLRAQGLLTELDAADLRFTLEEGIGYLRLYPLDPPLAHADLERLVKHTEGWAAGLTLTAIALSKQEDRQQFLDTFSGAHIYLREYFMEMVLQRSSPSVQAFLLQTSILKHLTGPLCDTVTGQTGGETMLSRLWQENLFIDRLEEPGWYRYHDLFAEMLRSQLQARSPQELPLLHHRAAQWCREQNAPADAIYHLLAVAAWDEAAALIEAMALRELEQYGEDSRLLRWLQALPEDVVQKHKTLLFVYLRLAEVALPRQKIERFVAHIEASITRKPAFLRTQDEREVLEEIGGIRRAWQQGEPYTPPLPIDDENAGRWELLNGLRFLRQEYITDPAVWEDQLINLMNRAQGNLFVLLMVGSVLARMALLEGQLRRSEKIAQQILEQARLQRGSLPEPASIALAVLSQVHLERWEIPSAERYLFLAQEVDPNPTSSNMLVQNAIQWAKIQASQDKFDEALANIQNIRDLHARRPSGMWTDQDLLAYEAVIHLRKGDLLTAGQIVQTSGSAEGHTLTQLVQAEFLLASGQPGPAEDLLNRLIAQNPNGIAYEPLLGARVLLALVLFAQHKNHQALQVITESIRHAAPERHIRPFLERGAGCVPLLQLALRAEKFTGEAQSFLREILHSFGQAEEVSQAQIEALSTSASISQREQEVLHLLNSGYANRDIAEQMYISESTVKTHLRNIYEKLGVSSRIQAVKRAKDLHLIG